MPAQRARERLRAGLVIPAHPLALTAARRLDERRQRALTRYYLAAGAGGIAVGVHTTQFAIREHGLYQPVLELAASVAKGTDAVLVAGIAGLTAAAEREAAVARDLGYQVGLVSLGALQGASDEALLAHCRRIAEVIPLFGFYLQPAVGGRRLEYGFWRRLADLEALWAVKIAPFDRYATAEVVRAVGDAGREDVALYTGNDDAIVHDLLTPFPSGSGTRWMDGGLLGQWAVWTRGARDLFARCRAARASGAVDGDLLRLGAALTETNAAIFDAAHGFAGCIPGIHAVLARQGLLAGTWCLDPAEHLSPGQAEAIERVCRAYPELADDAFVAEHLDEWLA